MHMYSPTEEEINKIRRLSHNELEYKHPQKIITESLMICEILKMKGLYSLEIFTANNIVISAQRGYHFLDITVLGVELFEIEYEYGIGRKYSHENLGIVGTEGLYGKLEWFKNL